MTSPSSKAGLENILCKGTDTKYFRICQSRGKLRYYLDIYVTQEKRNFSKCYFDEIQNIITKYICTVLCNTTLRI